MNAFTIGALIGYGIMATWRGFNWKRRAAGYKQANAELAHTCSKQNESLRHRKNELINLEDALGKAHKRIAELQAQVRNMSQR